MTIIFFNYNLYIGHEMKIKHSFVHEEIQSLQNMLRI